MQKNKLKEKYTQYSTATMKLGFYENEMTFSMSMQDDLINDK